MIHFKKVLLSRHIQDDLCFHCLRIFNGVLRICQVGKTARYGTSILELGEGLLKQTKYERLFFGSDISRVHLN